MIAAAGDLKAALRTSLDFEAALLQLRSVESEADLRAAAKVIDSPAFDDLSPNAQLELSAAYASAASRFMGFLG